MDKPKEPIDYNKPVAYDAEGQPLYAHPFIDEDNKQEEPVKRRSNHKVWTEVDNKEQPISDSVKIKHNRSKKIFPELNLDNNEYVISSVKRHPIGLFIPFTLGIFLVALSFIILFNYDLIIKAFNLTGKMANASIVTFPAIIFIIFIILTEYIIYYVFINNRFFLTNESVVQQIQTSLFSNGEQIVSLGNIEDASYSQNGIIQQIFNYGSIRLSTEGEETTYRFTYVSNPKECISTLDTAIEDFKNCRRPI